MSAHTDNTEATRAGPVDRYAPPSAGGAIDLRLDANECDGECVDLSALASALGAEAARRYPSAERLERAIADWWSVDPSRVVVTAGGDDAIDRACRVCLAPGREVILPVPTFEMIPRYARGAGATIVEVDWPTGPFPVGAVLDAVNERTAMIALVSPNNPTGAVATSDQLDRLARRAPSALLLVDLAYAEFADEDLMPAALALPNAVVVRTFSKAHGLAGMRVGYAIASGTLASRLRATGSPYPTSALSLGAAERALATAQQRLPSVVARVRSARNALAALLEELGARTRPSQGNFVLADFRDAEWCWRALAALGIGVRRFSEGAGLDRSLRITCPSDPSSLDRLCRGLNAALRPEALLLDMDGVIADVSRSYRRAITLTAEAFGVRLPDGAVSAAKAAGNANNDWELTQRLLRGHGVNAGLPDVTARFESLYHGGPGAPGLHEAEECIPRRETLERLALRVPLAIVTGRPRRDCERFLERFGLGGLFSAVVCMEDAPAKPDPAPARLALERLGATAAWMVGDTPDDTVCARGAGVVPIGIVAPGEAGPRAAEALQRAGSARVIESLEEIEGMLP